MLIDKKLFISVLILIFFVIIIYHIKTTDVTKEVQKNPRKLNSKQKEDKKELVKKAKLKEIENKNGQLDKWNYFAQMTEMYIKMADEAADSANDAEVRKIYEEWLDFSTNYRDIIPKNINLYRNLTCKLDFISSWKLRIIEIIMSRREGESPPEILSLVRRLKQAGTREDVSQIYHEIYKYVEERDKRMTECEICDRFFEERSKYESSYEAKLNVPPPLGHETFIHSKQIEYYGNRIGIEAINELFTILRGNYPYFLKSTALGLLSKYFHNPSPLVDPLIDLLNDRNFVEDRFDAAYLLSKVVYKLDVYSESTLNDFMDPFKVRILYDIDISNPEELKKLLPEDAFEILTNRNLTKEQAQKIIELFLAERDENVKSMLFKSIPQKYLIENNALMIRGILADKEYPKIKMTAMRYIESIEKEPSKILIDLLQNDKNTGVRIEAASMLIEKYGNKYLSEIHHVYDNMRREPNYDGRYTSFFISQIYSYIKHKFKDEKSRNDLINFLRFIGEKDPFEDIRNKVKEVMQEIE